jgi:hypothetical protein
MRKSNRPTLFRCLLLAQMVILWQRAQGTWGAPGMIDAIATISGRSLLRAFSISVPYLLLSACDPVRGVEVHRSTATASKINALQIRVDEPKISREQMLTPAMEPIASPSSAAEIQLNITNVYQGLDEGFRDRFPDMAKSYGLAVSPTAPTVLVVRITGTISKCIDPMLTLVRSNWCSTRTQLQGVLRDSNGNTMLTLSAEVTVGSYDKVGDAFRIKLFPDLARRWLEAMKTQGLMG